MQQKNMTPEPSDLCHSCQHGGGVVECCRCPHLREWGVLPRTLKNTLLLSNAKAIAKSKDLPDFDPLPFVAVTAATVNGSCRYYKAAQE